MNEEIFKVISAIIERDSTTTTYKYALLRGTIDIIQDNSPFIIHEADKTIIPMGLLVIKWLEYYYPLLESERKIPQINGSAPLAFDNQFQKIINVYRDHGGFSAFYNDLHNKGIPEIYKKSFLELALKINDTIRKNPMMYIGRSSYEGFYPLFKPVERVNKSSIRNVTALEIILHFGTYSIPHSYYEAFKILGSFIGGQASILYKWTSFSVNASKKSLTESEVFGQVIANPITDRQVAEAKELYQKMLKKEGKVTCVWSGKPITKYDVDHVIPFSIWKNNDLWNLLPADSKINGRKKDKIPSVEIIDQSKDKIVYYWQLLKKSHTKRFLDEITISLMGGSKTEYWEDFSINRLKENCNYLITMRGYEKWVMKS